MIHRRDAKTQREKIVGHRFSQIHTDKNSIFYPKNLCLSVSKISLIFILFSVSLCLCGKLVFASDCDWVESSGEAVVENITPDEARQTAINRARISAIESKTGVRVHGSTIVKDYQLLADMVQTLSQGYIIEEKLIKWEQGLFQESQDKAPLTTYKVFLKTCVAGVGEKDPYFKVDESVAQTLKFYDFK